MNILLILFAFRNPFTRDTRGSRIPEWGDVFMFGNWTINKANLIDETQDNDVYNLYLMPHPNQDELNGTLFHIEGGSLNYLFNVSLRFHGEDRDSFKVFTRHMEDDEEYHGQVEFSIFDNALLSAFGDIQNSNTSYTMTMISDKMMEVTTYDNFSKEAFIYRFSKPEFRQQQKSLWNQMMPYMAIFYFLFMRKKKATQGEDEPQQNNKYKKKKKGKKGKRNDN